MTCAPRRERDSLPLPLNRAARFYLLREMARYAAAMSARYLELPVIVHLAKTAGRVPLWAITDSSNKAPPNLALAVNNSARHATTAMQQHNVPQELRHYIRKTCGRVSLSDRGDMFCSEQVAVRRSPRRDATVP